MTTTTAPAPESTAPVAPAVVHVTVPISKIALHPRNPRRVVGNVDDIVDSIPVVGILEDLLVAPWPPGLDTRKPRGAEYVLIAGHRRLKAAKQAGLTEVPCKVRTDLDTRTKQLTAALVENLHREGLTSVEEADAYQELLDLDIKLTQTALAKQVGQPVGRVRERLKLAKLTAPVKDKVHAGQWTIADGIAVGAFADDPKVQKALIKKAGTPSFRHELEMAERARKSAAELEAKVAPYRDAGVPVADHSYDQLPAGWKSAQEIITGYKYNHVEDAALVKWDKTQHKDCPGRTVLARRGTSRLRFACSQGKLHPKTKPTKSAAELKRDAEAKARKAAFAPSSEAATAVRRRHIADGLFMASDGHSGHARAHLVDEILTSRHYLSERDLTARHRLVAELLGVDLDPNDDAVARRARLEASMGKLYLEGLVLLHLVMTTHKGHEEALAAIPKDGLFYHWGTESWVRVLDDVFGYQFSDWERETFKVDQVLGRPVETDDDDDDDLDLDAADAEKAELFDGYVNEEDAAS